MSHCQPLDLTVNQCCKAFFRNKTQAWQSEQFQKQIGNGITSVTVTIDLSISSLKPSMENG